MQYCISVAKQYIVSGPNCNGLCWPVRKSGKSEIIFGNGIRGGLLEYPTNLESGKISVTERPYLRKGTCLAPDRVLDAVDLGMSVTDVTGGPRAPDILLMKHSRTLRGSLSNESVPGGTWHLIVRQAAVSRPHALSRSNNVQRNPARP